VELGGISKGCTKDKYVDVVKEMVAMQYFILDLSRKYFWC
jgi:hypothetical protein